MVSPLISRQEDLEMWSSLRAWMEQDPERSARLRAFLEAPSLESQSLIQWLVSQAPTAPSQISTVISGGNVDKVINIATAEHVFITASEHVISPYQLPSDNPKFTGRTQELAVCMGELGAASKNSQTRCVVVSGMPGVGKSALATRACHLVAAAFPDAQLYLNLRGDGGSPTSAIEALAQILNALGMPSSAIAADLHSRAAQFRGLLAKKRALIFIDNAHSMDQVRHLIPASPTCAVVVTSRPVLDVEGAQFIRLDPLEPEESLNLLCTLAQSDLGRLQPDAAKALVSFSGGLPLALRIIAGLIRRSRHRSPSYFVAALQDERHRLANLHFGDLEMRASFDLSYRVLTPDQQRLFRFLGAIPGPTLTDLMISALVPEADQAIDVLVDAQLLEPIDGRYRLHDLVRLFASEKFAETESADERRELWIRLANWFTPYVRLAYSYIDPRDNASDAGSHEEIVSVGQGSLAWFDLERENLKKVLDELQSVEEWPTIFALATPFLWYLTKRGRGREGLNLAQTAAEAARASGDRLIEASLLNTLGAIQFELSARFEARKSFEQALAIVRSEKLRESELGIMVNLVGIEPAPAKTEEFLRLIEEVIQAYQAEFPSEKRALGSALLARVAILIGAARWAETIPELQKAWAIARESGDISFESSVLSHLASSLLNLGRVTEAAQVYKRVAQIELIQGDRHGYATALLSLSAAYNGLDLFDESIKSALEAVHILAEFGDLAREASARQNLGIGYTDLGKWDEAGQNLGRVLEIRESLKDELGMAQAITNLGNLESKRNRWHHAITLYQKALELFEKHFAVHDIARTKVNIASAQVQLSQFQQAADNLLSALPQLEKSRDLMMHAKALVNLGLAFANLGKLPEAVDKYGDALAIFEEVGNRHGQASVYHNLGRLLASQQRWDEAREYYQRDLDICLAIEDKPGVLTTLWQMFECAANSGDLPSGTQLLTQYVFIAHELGDKEAEGRALANLASMKHADGDDDEAIRLGCAALALLEEIGHSDRDKVRAFVTSLRPR